jgi:AcrR family transcriptional regulator
MASTRGRRRATGGGDPARAAGRPRDPDADEAILDAALAEMAGKGYARMTIDGVAEAAGVGKPTIYRRFSDKADLATAALARLQAGEAPALTGRCLDDLVAILREFRTNLLRPNGMAMIGTLLAEERHTPELLALFRERVLAGRRRMLRGVLEIAAGRGEIPQDADIDAAVNLLVGSFYARYLSGDRIGPDWPERVVRVVWEGLRAGGERESRRER